MASLLAFIRLSRLKFLLGGFLGVALGASIARYQGFPVRWEMLFIVQAAVTSFQLMTHYTNDYFDREADALAVRTPFSGGSGVFARNEIAPWVALLAARCSLVCGALALTILATQRDMPAVSIGALIAILAYSYSSPPLRLLALGLGEVTTAAVVAILVPLFSYAALAHKVEMTAFLSTLPAACAMFVMMICVEIPDIAVDGATGKRNLLVRFGRSSAPVLIAFATTGMALGAFLAIRSGAPRALLAAALLGMVLGTWLRAKLNSAEPPSDAWIARTGVAIFVVTLAAGVAAYLV
ncbi:MAG: prenyltransferase [Candidatus Baltobacteraceae bacterium]